MSSASRQSQSKRKANDLKDITANHVVFPKPGCEAATASIVSAPETTLLFTIIQPSMCYQDGEWKDNVHPDDLAENEAWAYENPEEKQGL
jgi:hypothetical protein